MQNIAVLLTCFNRKAKTLNALRSLKIAQHAYHEEIKLIVHLTDDGSTDGTSDAIQNTFPEVKILKGSGSLFWAGGMRNSWQDALKGNYDGFLLINDDTNVYENLFSQLQQTHEFCINTYGQSGIYIGSTQDPESKVITYGGAILTNKFLYKYNLLTPNSEIQECHLGNANIMLVTANVVSEIGILSDGYTHGIADYDYTLKAIKRNIPVLITPNYVGNCIDDSEDIYKSFPNMTFRERIDLMKNPLGLDWKSYLLFMKRHFPLRVPFVAASMILKVILPNFYVKNLRNR